MGGVRVTAGRAVFSPPSLFSLAFSFSLFLSHLFTHSHARSLSVFDERLKKKNYAKPKTWLHSSPLKVFRFSWLVFYRSTPLVVLSRPPSASLSAGFRASGHWKKKKKIRRLFVRRSRKTTATSHVFDGVEESLNARAASAGGTWEPYTGEIKLVFIGEIRIAGIVPPRGLEARNYVTSLRWHHRRWHAHGGQVETRRVGKAPSTPPIHTWAAALTRSSHSSFQ